MRKLVFKSVALLVIAMAAIAAGFYWKGHQEIQDGVRLAKKLVVKDFYDPESARFRGMQLRSSDGPFVSYLSRSTPDEPYSVFGFRYDPERFDVCGEVNAKNGFGAYTGYKHFYIIRDIESKKQILVIDSNENSEFAKKMCDIGRENVVFTEAETE